MSNDDSTKIRRVHFFDGEFLDAADFICEQDYHKDARQRHNQWLHTFGVAEGGLQVTLVPPGGGVGPNVVEISPGVAITSEGKELVVLPPPPNSPPFRKTIENPIAGYLMITAKAEVLDLDRKYDRKYEGSADGVSESSQMGRWIEQADFVMSASWPDSRDRDYGKKIPLAWLTVVNGVITDVDNTKRQFAGSKIDPAADLRVRSLTADAGLTVEQGQNLYFKAGSSCPATRATLFSTRPTSSRRPGSTRSPGKRTSCI